MSRGMQKKTRKAEAFRVAIKWNSFVQGDMLLDQQPQDIAIGTRNFPVCIGAIRVQGEDHGILTKPEVDVKAQATGRVDHGKDSIRRCGWGLALQKGTIGEEGKHNGVDVLGLIKGLGTGEVHGCDLTVGIRLWYADDQRRGRRFGAHKQVNVAAQ